MYYMYYFTTLHNVLFNYVLAIKLNIDAENTYLGHNIT